MLDPLISRLRFLVIISLFLAVASCWTPILLRAQNITGTILGSVADPSGASIPRADVTATNQATNESQTVKTSQTGAYEIPYLRPGSYRIKVEHPGFETGLRTDIILQVDSQVVLNFVLTVGSASTVVSVVGHTPLVDTTTGSLGQNIPAHVTQELPMMGRSIFDIVGIAAGVSINPQYLGLVAYGGFNESDYSINGGRFRTNEFLLDGVSIMVPENNNATLAPTPEEVQDYKIMTNSIGPQFGRSGGGVLNMVTKGGTNHWHGEGYSYGRDRRMNANSFFSNAQGGKLAPFDFFLFGFDMGGPIVKDKTFIFGSYEKSRQHSLNPGGSATVPTAAQRQGDFSQTLTSGGSAITIYNPFTTTSNGSGGYTRTAFSNNLIPTSLLNPVALKVLTYIPLPNQAGTGPAGVNNYTWSQILRIGMDQWTVRADHRFSDRQTAFARVTRNTWSNYQTGTFNNPAQGATLDVTSGLSAVLNDTITLSPSTFLNWRYGLTRRFENSGTFYSNFDPTSLGFPPAIKAAAQNLYFPAFIFTNYGTYGAAAGTGIHRENTINTFVADVTKIHGRHTFVYGSDARLYDQDPFQGGAPTGAYTFSSGFTQGPNPLVTSLTSGYDLASFLVGYGTGSIYNSPALAMRNWYWALYFNDAIKLGRLTLNAGLRYDYAEPLSERYNRFADFDFTAPFPITVSGLPNLKGVLTHPGQNGLPRGQTDSYWKSFGPRVGLAYRLSSKMAVRAGYGIFYPPAIGATNGLAFGVTGAALTTNWVSSLDGVTPLNSLSNPFPGGVLVPPTTQADLLQLGQSLTVDNHWNINNTYIQQRNLNLQWEPANNWLLQVAYVGLEGTHEPTYSNWNQLNPSYQALGSQLTKQVTNPFYGLVSTGTLSTPTVAQSQLLLPYPQYTGVSTPQPPILENDGVANYNALEVTVEHRFKGMYLLLSYTNGKGISNSSGRVYGITAFVPYVENAYDLSAERSIDQGDISQRLVISHVVELPFGRGKPILGSASGVLNHIVGGWSADGVITLNTGFPLQLTSSGSAGVGSPVQRPNAVAGVSPRLSGAYETRLTKFFNTAAFTIPASYTFGNASRTVPNAREPGRRDYDFGLGKTFLIKEPFSLRFRAEAFNLTNTPYFAAPGLSLGSSSFGVISSASQQRNMQLSLKLLW